MNGSHLNKRLQLVTYTGDCIIQQVQGSNLNKETSTILTMLKVKHINLQKRVNLQNILQKFELSVSGPVTEETVFGKHTVGEQVC